MKSILFFAIVSLFDVSLSSLINRRQRIIAKGKLMCGSIPSKNVDVKLYDYDKGDLRSKINMQKSKRC